MSSARSIMGVFVHKCFGDADKWSRYQKMEKFENGEGFWKVMFLGEV